MGWWNRSLLLAAALILAAVLSLVAVLPGSDDPLALAHADNEPRPLAGSTDVLATWPGPQVTYTFVNCPVSLDCAVAHRAVRDALGAWDRVMELDLVEVSSGGDIQIRWAIGAITATTSFDGQGGVLAFGVPPYTWSALAGDLIFDDSERWVVDQPYYAYPVTIDLRSVALHEAGHSLGLNHISDPNSIMYAVYSPQKTLSAGDVALIQSVYGAESSPIAAQTLNAGSQALPSGCQVLTKSRVNLRAAASQDAEILALLSSGTHLTVLNWGPTYTQVEYGSVSGWIATSYLTLLP